MLVVGEDILNQNLLSGADRSHIKNSSYYLTIGALIPVGDAARNFDFDKPPRMLVIKPRQVAWVVSKELFNIESHEITALVTLRSTFTKKGLLALDVGMVDAGFKGPIGSIVINFSKNDVTLNTGDEFFRVAFMKHPEIAAEFRSSRPRLTAIDYMKERHGEIVGDFPATFLNTEALAEEMTDEIAKKVKDDILDKALNHIVKNHWRKLLIAIIAVLGLVALVFYLLYSKYGPPLTTEEVQGIVKTWIEKNLPKQLPKT